MKNAIRGCMALLLCILLSLSLFPCGASAAETDTGESTPVETQPEETTPEFTIPLPNYLEVEPGHGHDIP